MPTGDENRLGWAQATAAQEAGSGRADPPPSFLLCLSAVSHMGDGKRGLGVREQECTLSGQLFMLSVHLPVPSTKVELP
jgi:hypothetical protein